MEKQGRIMEKAFVERQQQRQAKIVANVTATAYFQPKE